jgi:very-short-patch-repair endonuclease
MENKSAERWAAVTALASNQHGRVTTRQLAEAGIGPGAIEKALRSQRLFRQHRGVYVVGHRAPSDHGRWTGAVLACGDDAALSHRSGATLWRFRRGEGPRVDVTVDTVAGRRRRTGIEVHRGPLAGEVVTRDGIRVTSVARTLVDLAHVIEPDELVRAVREAQFLRLFNLRATRAALARRPSRVLRELLEDMTVSSSQLEDGFVRLLQRHHLPLPVGQEWLLGHRVDYVWTQWRVAVELDGYDAHVSLDAFQRDRTQNNALQLAGWILLRFTWADVHRHPQRTVATIRRALGGKLLR